MNIVDTVGGTTNTTTKITDKAGNLTDVTDSLGHHTHYDYDKRNRQTKITDAEGGVTEYTYIYDKNGNRITASDSKIHYDYRYDKTDLLEQVDRVQAGNPTVSFKYDYDNVGNLTKSEESVANNIQATTIYKYDDPRYLNTEIIQTGVGLTNKDVKFTYNAAGSNTRIERYVDGLLKVKTTNAFDDYGRLTGIEQKNGAGTVIGNSVYDLDIQNRLRGESKDGQSRNIGYDNIDQVKTVTGSNTEAYSYDKNGNRTNAGYVTDSYNRLQSDGVYSYIYDAEGNRTKRTKIVGGVVDNYAWDYRNRLVSIVTTDAGVTIKSVGYEYDADDQRVRKTVDTSTLLSASGVVENYVLDRDQIAFVTDGSGNQMFHYLYGLNVDAVMAQDSPGGMLWSLADRLGSIDTLTDAGGTVVDQRTFDSFGRVLSETNPSVSFRYGYTGRERDLESGLDYYRARYYDSNVGRFISVDPLGFGAGDTNLYRYVGNNSTNATDPSGEFWHIAIGAAIGGVAGGLLSIGRQFAKVADGGSFDTGEVLNATATGFIAGGVIAAVPALALSAGIVGTAFGLTSASNEFSKGNYNTAAFDLLTSAISFGGTGGFGKLPQLNFGGGSLALAGGGSVAAAATSVPGAVIGAGAIGSAEAGIFQHYFAMSNSTGDTNDSETPPTDPNSDLPNTIFRGDKGYNGGSVGHPIGSKEWETLPIQTPWDHVNPPKALKNLSSSEKSKFVSWSGDRGKALKFADTKSISKVSTKSLKDLKDEIVIYSPETVKKMMLLHEDPAVNGNADNIYDQMNKNHEYLIEGSVPGNLVKPVNSSKSKK